MSVIVVLNGPPGSGKDALAKEIVSNTFKGKHLQVKDPLFEAVLSLSQITKEDWFERYEDRLLKEEPWD